jgi:hypothetical protein
MKCRKDSERSTFEINELRKISNKMISRPHPQTRRHQDPRPKPAQTGHLRRNQSKKAMPNQ